MPFDRSSPTPAIPIPDDLLHDLLVAIRRQYRLHWTGIHGASHWARVLENGLRLAADTGADTEVVAWFALFHDACRLNDHHDPRHGARGAALAAELLRPHLDGRHDQLHLLIQACTLHTSGQVRDFDATVLTCWDADRLDLLRAGITPVPDKLCTDAARNPSVIAWASDRAVRDHVPPFARTGGWVDRRSGGSGA